MLKYKYILYIYIYYYILYIITYYRYCVHFFLYKSKKKNLIYINVPYISDYVRIVMCFYCIVEILHNISIVPYDIKLL
jgi:hypothetical protein